MKTMTVLLALGLCLSAAGRSGELDGSEWLAVPDAPVATDADERNRNVLCGADGGAVFPEVKRKACCGSSGNLVHYWPQRQEAKRTKEDV